MWVAFECNHGREANGDDNAHYEQGATRFCICVAGSFPLMNRVRRGMQ